MRRDDRERELDLAIKRIQVGRPRVVKPGRKLSVTSVAEELGIDPSTIHSRYPSHAKRIRDLSGRAEDDRIVALKAQLTVEKGKVRELRETVRTKDRLLAKVASQLATRELELERALLTGGAGKVSKIR